MGFAIADASDDADTAKALVLSVSTRLANEPINGWTDIQYQVSAAMTEWRAAYTQDAPTVHLILIVALKDLGVQLYFCKPPNTVLPKPEGYVAAGAGAAVTDPLMSTLFPSFPPSLNPQIALREVAYLTYRAKKDNAWCGGQTDIVYIDRRDNRPRLIHAPDVKQAEAASFQLDNVLGMASIAMLGGGPWLENNTSAIGSLILQCDHIRNAKFRDISGHDI